MSVAYKVFREVPIGQCTIKMVNGWTIDIKNCCKSFTALTEIVNDEIMLTELLFVKAKELFGLPDDAIRLWLCEDME